MAGCGLFLVAGYATGWAGDAYPLATIAFGISILFGAWQVVPVGLRGIWRDRTLDINILVSVAAAGAVALGDWSEAATVISLFMLGDAIEDFTLSRTTRSVDALLATIPTIAQVLDLDGLETPTLVVEVPVGAIVVVRPGERIPVDGVVVRGTSAVDQAALTGESIPLDRARGDPVFGGPVIRNGYLEVCTTRPFSDTALARVVRVAEEAITEPSDGQRLVRRFAKVYTSLVVAVAVILAVLVPCVVRDPIAAWFDRALVLILGRVPLRAAHGVAGCHRRRDWGRVTTRGDCSERDCTGTGRPGQDCRVRQDWHTDLRPSRSSRGLPGGRWPGS
ncbi:MAG: cation-translocating P-type ATPase [Chloroflexi bacterium]|nr:cation-translocating P-type ATPase [Chloroflexota bacterium]